MTHGGSVLGRIWPCQTQCMLTAGDSMVVDSRMADLRVAGIDWREGNSELWFRWCITNLLHPFLFADHPPQTPSVITDAETLAWKVWTEKYKKEISKPAAQTNPTNDVCISINSLILYIALFSSKEIF